VRLRHGPSGLIVIAEESRSQHENKAKALRRVRQALYLQIRDDLPDLSPEAVAALPDYQDARGGDGRLHLGKKDQRFWPAVGVVLDVLEAAEARVSAAAELLGISTGNLIDFVQSEPKVWQQVNVLRARCGQKPLRST
jgi:hypothetical protein